MFGCLVTSCTHVHQMNCLEILALSWTEAYCSSHMRWRRGSFSPLRETARACITSEQKGQTNQRRTVHGSGVRQPRLEWFRSNGIAIAGRCFAGTVNFGPSASGDANDHKNLLESFERTPGANAMWRVETTALFR